MKMFKTTMMALAVSASMAFVQNVYANAPASETYEQARAALDNGNYPQARELFAEIAAAGGPRAEDAMYWKAYAEERMGNERAAMRSIAELTRLFPESRWVDDAKALELQMRNHGNAEELPEDEELKLYALQALVLSNPEKAVPIIKRYLEEGKSDQLKERALFLLLQADTEESRELLGTAALGASSVMLQVSAIRTLGMIGDKESLDLLERAYRETDNENVRAQIVNAFMTSGEAGRIKAVLEDTDSVQVRTQAIQMLGVMGETEFLRGLYPDEESEHTRRIIVQSMAMGGDAEFLMEIIRNETATDLRIMAIQSLMMVDAGDVSGELVDIYRDSESENEKHVVVQALAMQGAAEELRTLFREEDDKGLRRQIMHSMAMFLDEDETSDFFLEILEEEN